MANVFGRIAGELYIHCSSDREFRDVLDKLLANQITVAADPKRRVLAVNFGDDPDDEDTSTDLSLALQRIDVIGQIGSFVTDEAGWKPLREQDEAAAD